MVSTAGKSQTDPGYARPETTFETSLSTGRLRATSNQQLADQVKNMFYTLELRLVARVVPLRSAPLPRICWHVEIDRA